MISWVAGGQRSDVVDTSGSRVVMSVLRRVLRQHSSADDELSYVVNASFCPPQVLAVRTSDVGHGRRWSRASVTMVTAAARQLCSPGCGGSCVVNSNSRRGGLCDTSAAAARLDSGSASLFPRKTLIRHSVKTAQLTSDAASQTFLIFFFFLVGPEVWE